MKPSLVIMAAGMGSRYGGLKQIEPIGPAGEIMLDYSVYDAIRAGFGKVVFVIREAIADEFREVVEKRAGGRIAVEYVFQELSDLPDGYCVPANRAKPWGTGHAVMQCAGNINEPFAVINADDFYGKDSYSTLCNALSQLSNTDNTFFMTGFRLYNTLSEHGHVTRGICEIDSDEMLISVTERFKIEKLSDGRARFEDESGEWVVASGDETASMNMFGFTPALFGELDRLFPVFLQDAMNNPKAEFLLPNIVHTLIGEGRIVMKVLKTPEKWLGITYKEDTAKVIEGIRAMVEAGVYPSPLWS